jgi:hypothetical protein
MNLVSEIINSMAHRRSWAKTQHYVPQFLLRNFAETGKDQIHVFDKREERVFRAHVRKVAAESGLYDINMPQGVVSAESALSSLEGAASAAITKILRGQTLKMMTKDEIGVLAIFIGTQMLRVTHQVETIFQMTELLRKKWGTLPGMPENEMDAKKQAREAMVQNLHIALDLLPHLLNKTWLLFKAHPDSTFYISDNPVTMHNASRNPWRGSLGVAVKGIEIHLPLSPAITLALYCKSHEEGWMLTKAQHEILQTAGIVVPPGFEAQEAAFAELLRGLETGTPIQLSAKVTAFQNELQIWNSSRFLFSGNIDFELVKDSIKRDPAFKHGPQLAGG